MADIPFDDLPRHAASASHPETDSRPRILIVCDDTAMSAELAQQLAAVARVETARPDDIVELARNDTPAPFEEFALYAQHHSPVLAPLTLREPDERHGAYGPPRRGRKGKLLRW
ncbi:hypothetical protein [Paraburkholderia sp. A3RO-2L]|uniref:hypothetical protein n=1 Tax=unclassified Paraburkholderia TaxID=2615204 RepID=UPI0032FFD0E2|nr:hypothetical protein [Burkholderia vietnamiensis]